MNCALISTPLKHSYDGVAWRSLSVPVILTGALLIALRMAGVAGYRINLTPSMPLGIWQITASSEYPRGAAVAICPPIDASFLPRGSCPLGMQPLLKQIIGVPGDVVNVTPAGVRINGGPLLPHSAPLSHTRDGQPLPQRRGTWRLTGYWLYGVNSPRSFDSRYFGDVPPACLQHRVERVL